MSDNEKVNNTDNEEIVDQAVEEVAEDLQQEAEKQGPTPGETVVCILEANEEKIFLLGKGEYKGDEQIPEDVAERVGPTASIMRMAKVANPVVELESGDTVYGCECHIGPVEGYEEWKGDREEEIVSIEDVRSGDYDPVTTDRQQDQEE